MVKVKLSLDLTKYHNHEDVWHNGGIAPRPRLRLEEDVIIDLE
jgi:hypothetical protein